jgi:hypothetical protein
MCPRAAGLTYYDWTRTQQPVDESLTQLTQEELQELIRSGRINASRTMTRKKKTKEAPKVRNEAPKVRNEAPKVRNYENRPKPETNPKAPDPEWLTAQKEKAERNIVTPRYDKGQKSDMEEASKF